MTGIERHWAEEEAAEKLAAETLKACEVVKPAKKRAKAKRKS